MVRAKQLQGTESLQLRCSVHWTASEAFIHFTTQSSQYVPPTLARLGLNQTIWCVCSHDDVTLSEYNLQPTLVFRRLPTTH